MASIRMQEMEDAAPLARRTSLPLWVKALVTFAAVGTALNFAAFGILLARSQDETEAAIYDIGYRICAREAVDRGYAWLRDPQPSTKRILPLLDCRPNLVGKPAKILLPPDAERFVIRLRDNKLSLAEQGICKTTIKVGDDNIC